MVRMIFLGLLSLALVIKALVNGHNVALLNPKGLIAQQEFQLIMFTAVVLLTVALPVLGVLFYTAWKYRESNPRAVHDPAGRHGKSTVPMIWGIPSIFMFVLALVMWPATHRLEPQKAIAANVKPITIEVISTRWKWIFIYPEQKIATVNFLQIPAGTPVQFELTADEAPMSSFWIPNLGGMLYTMTGMVNHLNLLADTPGDYPGSSGEINGAGLADMRFTARVGSQSDFDQWVQEVKVTGDSLNTAEYQRLLKPSENHPVTYYSEVEAGLYDKVLMKYMGPDHGQMPGMHMNMGTE